LNAAARSGGRKLGVVLTPDRAPCLYLCPTPVGNLEDITLRAQRVLAEAELVYAEDTRRTAQLLNHLGIRARLRSLHVGNEDRRAEEAVNLWAQGWRVALVSDAGSPLLSDPGFPLVRAAIREGVAIVPLPGATAVIPALTASGLPVVPFRFIGFLPRTRLRRRRLLEGLAGDSATLVAYEAPHRLAASLTDLLAVLGPRQACVAREISKLHEHFRRDNLAVLAAEDWSDVRGEIVLVIAGG
jgi:16S rRNA (cytidine1402-2'-O)-methyltransferase